LNGCPNGYSKGGACLAWSGLAFSFVLVVFRVAFSGVLIIFNGHYLLWCKYG
jgi:hypothetical protein